MKNQKGKNSFFGLSASERTKIVEKALDKATEDQLKVVNRHGGMGLLKKYSG